MSSFQTHEEDICKAMLIDQRRLRRDLRAILADSARGKRIDRRYMDWEARLKRSIALRESRRQGLPTVSYDEALPVVQRRDEIAAAVREHQVVIVCGETGSGKSTQIPKICLELGRGVEAMIGHTQPRRIAARSIAARIAEELGSPLGEAVGFKIRFAESLQPNTYIKLMTDGILLAECQTDPLLEHYDTIIIDEAHERSLNIDFLLGYLKRILPQRRDLKLIITSATIDAARFAEHFASARAAAPVIEVSGRTYPVEIRYRPLTPDDDGNEPDWEDAVAEAVDELTHAGPGDILIFMPTERDIHEMTKKLRGRVDRAEILPLYARLSMAEQQRVFQPHRGRRIVIATNVAESSLTVPGIRYVIDPGTARISRYSARTKTQRLPIEPISQASANQRAGRCGRVAEGICIRLYSEEDFANRERFTAPEIQRTNLASVILQTKALRLGDIERFPFLDPPRSDAIRDGYKTLVEIGALDRNHALTDIGRQLARLPLDPRIGRMILAAHEENCLAEVLILAAVLELQDPRERPLEKQEAADQAHAQFADPDSDFLSYLKLWDFYHDLKANLSRNQLRKACQQHFLSYQRMREWTDIHLQLLQLAEEAGMKPGPRRNEYAPIHRAILHGLLSNVAVRADPRRPGSVFHADKESDPGNARDADFVPAGGRPIRASDYLLAGGRRAVLWPGSGVFQSRPRWIVAAEVVETTNRYLRCCAAIDPRWIEPIAGHLVHRSYSDVHWDRASASAVAFEKVTLFGLVLVSGRRVRYGPIDPAASRDLLIRQGLVEGEIDLKADFLQHNERLVQELERLQAKLRRNDLLRPTWDRFDFYDQRIPPDVYDGQRLMRWLAAERKKNPQALFMSKADLLRDPEAEAPPHQFPETISVGDRVCAVEYRFEPGSAEDGVTLAVPCEALGQLDAGRLGWLVPGLLEHKLVALIRALPKEIRRHLIPAPEMARKALAWMRFGEGDFLQAAAAALGRVSGQRIPPEAFQEDKIPEALRMNLRVVDAAGQTLASGRDLNAVRQKLGEETAAIVGELDDPTWTRDGLKHWDFDALPERVEVRRGHVTIQAFPMLVDQGDAVGLRLAETPQRAEQETRGALRRLFTFFAQKELQSQTHWLPQRDVMELHARLLPQFDFSRHVGELLAERAIALALGQIPRTKAEFEALMATARSRIGLAVQDIAKLIGPLLETHYQARLALERLLENQGGAVPLAAASLPATTASKPASGSRSHPLPNPNRGLAVAQTFQPSRAADHSRWHYLSEDVRQQLEHLVVPGFLVATPWEWLQQYPRYFRAIVIRLDAARGDIERDRRHCEEIRRRWLACREKMEENRRMGIDDAELTRYRWMLEEYRVSLFAQRLGTCVPVSAKRLDQQWARVVGKP